jgi:hypothetical protein
VNNFEKTLKENVPSWYSSMWLEGLKQTTNYLSIVYVPVKIQIGHLLNRRQKRECCLHVAVCLGIFSRKVKRYVSG